MSEKKYKEVDSTDKSASDEASYYDGDQFELGGVSFGDGEAPDRQSLISSIEAHFDVKDLNVEVEGATVFLTGAVDSLETKSEVEKYLSDFTEIDHVENELRLIGEASRRKSIGEVQDADRFKIS